MAFQANVAFGRYQRGQEIDTDGFSAAQLRDLESSGYITEQTSIEQTGEQPRRRRAAQTEEPDGAVLRASDIDAG